MVVYANLTPSQQAQVDMTWGNLMSYHDPDNRSMISPCQMDRESTQAYTDRNWILSKLPVYVDAANGGTHNGSFTEPYQTIQAALSANIFTGELNGNAMVLEQGIYSRPSGTINTPCDIITRKGASTIQDAPPTYSLPYAVEKSTNAAVRQAVLRAQQCDRKGDLAGVIVNLKEAEQHATGREKSVLQLELAQRHRESGRLEEAENWFKKLAEGADQPALKNHALREMDDMNKKARLQKQQKTGTNSSTLKK